MPAEPPIEIPEHLSEAYALLAAAPHVPIAGGTDIMVRITGEIGPVPDRMLDLSRLADLEGISLERGVLVLGARTTYTEIRRSALCREHLPALVEAAATIGAAQIQNRGTLGGNIANASPAGDTLPVLLALDADIVLGSHAGERVVPAGDFFPSYRATALRGNELILRVRIPLVPGREARFRKVGGRRAQAISKVVMAVAWRDHGATAGWSDVRVALGSVAATPIRAAGAEAVLEGARPSPEVADAAAEALAAELHPIDDVRSTATYRRTVAARILHRIVRDAGGW
ncbi:MAG TPA: xanthine dehydrogenase family protein subunit M [Candidatus Limnocylindrales bacterium]|nr:xanthine dehydrogenase family protein subunit M [Candidatus Limnocylindrales bacterium]